MLERLSTKTIETLYLIAKHNEKGARPFFANPHAMIALREELSRRLNCSK
jgi:hypothetical protein